MDTCARTLERAQELIDSRAQPSTDPEIEAHIDVCASCRGHIIIIDGLDGLLRGQTDPEPPASLVGDVVAAMSREAARARRRVHAGWAAAVAAVVAVAIAIGALGWDPIAATRDLANDGTVVLERASRVSEPRVDAGTLDDLRASLQSALDRTPAVPFALAIAAALAAVHVAAAMKLREARR